MKIISGDNSDSFMRFLHAFVHGGSGTDGVSREPRPVWGTCAGCILLSDDVVNELPSADKADKAAEPAPKRCKYGDPVGGLAISTCRNFFGRQFSSFEAEVTAPKGGPEAFAAFPAVFI